MLAKFIFSLYLISEMCSELYELSTKYALVSTLNLRYKRTHMPCLAFTLESFLIRRILCSF